MEIKINKIPFPSPDNISISFERIGGISRAIDGSLLADVVALKIRINCRFNILEDEKLAIIMQEAKNLELEINAKNPMENKNKIYNMIGEISPGSIAININEKIWWRGVECVFIEK